MEYRRLPHGTEKESFSVLGLGMGGIQHTPAVANTIIDTGVIYMMMFSINPAYDFEKGDDYGIGSVRKQTHAFSAVTATNAARLALCRRNACSL